MEPEAVDATERLPVVEGVLDDPCPRCGELEHRTVIWRGMQLIVCPELVSGEMELL